MLVYFCHHLPLSSCCVPDAHVGEHLFTEAIRGVLRNQTRILVTHQLQFLPQVDRIIVMDKGRVLHAGSYAQLITAGVSFASLTAGDESSEAPEASALSTAPKALRRSSSIGSEYSDDLTPMPALSLRRASSADSTPATSAVKQVAAMGQSVQLSAGQAIEDEERYVGTVQGSVYKMYLESLGGWTFAILFVLISLVLEATRTGAGLWIAAWSNDPEADLYKQMAVYLGLGVGVSILTLIRNFGWFYATCSAARALHERMLGAVIRAPIGWFNATPQV